MVYLVGWALAHYLFYHSVTLYLTALLELNTLTVTMTVLLEYIDLVPVTRPKAVGINSWLWALEKIGWAYAPPVVLTLRH